MTDTAHGPSPRSTMSQDRVAAGLAKRYAAERRFRLYGRAAIAIAVACLALVFAVIAYNGYSGFVQTQIRLPVDMSLAGGDIKAADDPAALAKLDYAGAIKKSTRQFFSDVEGRREKRKLSKLFSIGAAYELRAAILADPAKLAEPFDMWLTADDVIDTYYKDRHGIKIDPSLQEWVERLRQEGRIETKFNSTFFTAGDSREPELAGILGATVGSCLTLLVTLAVAFPIGVMAAIYLQEFAPTNRWVDVIEVNINNLAAVPSIVFGLLGLAIFLNFAGLPRSSALVGGLVLALLTLPTIIVAARAALAAVPPSIREAALGIGASHMQSVVHHVLPAALPGIMTGTIIGMARALGETAPLLMIGMVAFIVDVPQLPTDAATVLPVQIYLWADSPERAFVERMSAAIIVLLVFLVVMNLAAVIVRRKFEQRW